MKKTLACIVIAALLMTGCSAKDPQNGTAKTSAETSEMTETTETTETAETTVLVLPEYDPELEQYADGFTSSEALSIVIDEFVHDYPVPSGIFDASRGSYVFAEGDDRYNVTSDIKLLGEVDGFKITWWSSDESLIKYDGTVTRPKDQSKFVLLISKVSAGDSYIIAKNTFRIAREDPGTDYPEMKSLKNIENTYYGEYSDFETYFDFEYGERRLRLFGLYGPDIGSAEEAERFIHSFDGLAQLGSSELRLESVNWSLNDIYYDYVQYYKGVRTSGHVSFFTFLNDLGFVDLISTIIPISDNFDVTPAYTSEEVMEDYDLKYKPDLIIQTHEGKTRLTWEFYIRDFIYVVDARDGTLLMKHCTVVS